MKEPESEPRRPAAPPGAGPRPARRRRWTGPLLSGATLVLALLLAEVALLPFPVFRPFPRFDVGEMADRPDEHFVPHPVYGWTLRPSFEVTARAAEYTATYRTGPDGFRTGARAHVSGDCEITLLGDSYAFGWGVDYEDSMGAQIESALPGCRVTNLALPGYGVDQMWVLLRERGLAGDPDLVIVALCDADLKRSQAAFRIYEGFNKPAFRLEDGRLVPRTAKNRASAPIRFLERHSRVWMAGRLALRWLGYRLPVGEWWSLNAAILDRLRADAAERNVPLLFVHVPASAWRPFPTLRRYMERHEAAYIDLREDAPADPRMLYYPMDRHFNAAGHAHAAGRILDWIEANLPQLGASRDLENPE